MDQADKDNLQIRTLMYSIDSLQDVPNECCSNGLFSGRGIYLDVHGGREKL